MVDHTFTRRTLLLGGAQILLTGGLIARLYGLQVTSNAHYAKLSDNNRLHSEFVLPLRGHIFDKHGTLLAGNTPSHQLMLHKDQTESFQEWRQSLRQACHFLNISSDTYKDIFKTAKATHPVVPVVIKESLSWEEVTLMEVHQASLPGIRIHQGYMRTYNQPHEFCHILGHVGRARPKDMEENPELFRQNPKLCLGKAGVEKLFDDVLQGRPGVNQIEVNASRRVVREIASHAPRHGDHMTLTLDQRLQSRIYDRLSSFESASSVVMDIQTGGILAAVSYPSFDMNHFTSAIPASLWSNLLQDPHTPLVSKFSQGQYAPGSTFKMVVLLAALQEKVATPETRFSCCGYHDVNGHRFHCYSRIGHGALNMEQALAQSCDIYFYRLGLLMGMEPIYRVAKEFGLGAPSSLAFPNEKSGLMPTKDWKKRIKGGGWRPADTVNFSIGQGYALATPLQLCIMTTRFASNMNIQPTLIETVAKERLEAYKNGTYEGVFSSMRMEAHHWDVIKKGMRRVMSDPIGTAYRYAKSPLPGVDFAGKTGTSQVRRITMRDRKLGLHKNWPWHWCDHALFVGYAPYIQPKYAVSVIVEHGKVGSRVAAPIGRDILSDAINLKA